MTTTSTGILRPRRSGSSARSHGLAIARPAVLGFARILTLSLSTAVAAPLGSLKHGDTSAGGDEPEEGGADAWVLYVASVVLVLLGGAFAGLTIALMGQDDIYLRVLSTDKAEPQQKNAKRVHDLLSKGKHWVLVTLLLSNVIVNETLPVVLDRCLGGGVAAVVGSTILIVIFGEILPQSVCVRYGLPIGGYMSKPVLLLMYLMAPVAWPTAKLLDWVLGEDHGTVYKKSGLKTLVTLHKSLGEVSNRLNQDEVTIISAVLDLKEKPVAQVMTPMEDVFVMSEDTVLNEPMMDLILSAGYSRIPIHEPGNATNFVGMLLVKILITYDPEDSKLVRDFPLATLPETRPETSCLDIVNFFQEGKSHMVLVSECPGEDRGALGVVTLEDVIEELIGEEIIDESDVYVDVHKAIRRLTPAPHVRLHRQLSNTEAIAIAKGVSDADLEDLLDGQEPRHNRVNSIGGKDDVKPLSSSPKTATFMMRRASTGVDGKPLGSAFPVRANIEEMRKHLKHLGPSNPATNPRDTRYTTVKIKPGGTHPRAGSLVEELVARDDDFGDETTTLLTPNISGKDGARAVRQSYGGIGGSEVQSRLSEVPSLVSIHGGGQDHTDIATQTSAPVSQVDLANAAASHNYRSDESVGSQRSEQGGMTTPTRQRHYVRSGSITENIVETRGIRKVVLETNSSGDDEVVVVESKMLDTPSRSRTSFLPVTPELVSGKQSQQQKQQVHKQEQKRKENQVQEGQEQGQKQGREEEALEEEDSTAAPSDSVDSQTNGQAGGMSAGAAGKKKNRRKKRKGGKS